MSTRPRSFWSRSLAAILIGPVLWAPIHVGWPQPAMAQEVPAEPGENGANPDSDDFTPPQAGDFAPADPDVPVDDLTPAESPGPSEASINPAALEEAGQQIEDMLDEDGTAYSAPSTTGAGDKSAASPQAISLPKAEGSIQGMGESFSPVLSSGTATYTVPIALPPGRAGFAPEVSFSYSSSAGGSEVGIGWSLSVPFIARQADRGVPRYIDGDTWHAEEDRFYFGGGQELVPVSSTSAMLVDCGSANCAPIPSELTGWQQYRARVEGAYQRFFRSPDSRRWVVQSKDGTRYDFGVLTSGVPTDVAVLAVGAVQSELPLGLGRIFRWYLTRVTDPHGSTAYFTYLEDQGQRYLADIHYLSPHGACGSLSTAADRMQCNAPLLNFGRRAHLVYEPRADALTSYLTGWPITTGQRLSRIEIGAATGAPGTRTFVRAYQLAYDPDSYHSLLTSIQVLARTGTTDSSGVVTGDPTLPEGSSGVALLPPIRFTYTRQPGATAAALGFGGIDDVTQLAPSSPPHSIDEDRADLFDVNSDGLPDLIVTDPARFSTAEGAPAVGVFFNGFEGAGASPGDHGGIFSDAVPMEIPPGLSSTLTLSNANIVPMDIDADGRSDLLHMPRVANYGYFTALRDVAPTDIAPVSPAEQGWRWSYVERALPEGYTDPRIDFTGDSPFIRAFDVNHDHLIDVVKTTGTSIQTWFNLGWLPGGDGRFGSATWDGNAWVLSPDPTERCLPVAGLPIDFADPEIKLGDLNGDGLQDIVRMSPGSVIYWPGRGDGTWGVGATGDNCPAGFVGDREIDVGTAPGEINPELDAVYLIDANADGLDDIIQVRYTAVDVWFNEGGVSFTGRVIASGTPYAPAFANRVRVVDIDGSGTLDVLYANSGAWKWVDLMGGQRPRLLSTVTGSLGGEAELSYASSIEDYLADLRDAEDCASSSCERFTWASLPGDCDQKVIDGSGDCAYRSGGSPVVSTVVRSTISRDGLGSPDVVNAYAYHDGYYEGIEHEFRGFGAATEEAIGDANHRTSRTRTYFHQGRRASHIASDPLADNPDEPLKAHPYRTEIWDPEFDKYLSTTHRTLTVRDLHTGLDGRGIRTAFESQSDELLYDFAGFVPSGSTITVPHIVRPGATEDVAVPIRATIFAHTRTTADEVDNLGQPLQATTHGRITPETPGEDLSDETIVNHATYINVSGSATGWLWCPSVTWVTGNGDPTALGHTTYAYNSACDATSTTIDVNQTGTYSFAPTLGSPSPEDISATKVVDNWGNATISCVGGVASTGANCLRYRTVTYDTDYATFPISESQAARRNGGGWDFLTTTATWDRGIGAPVTVTDPNGEQSSVTLDGMGRLTSFTPPPVVGCASGQETTRIEYDIAEPSELPLHRVVTTSVLSCDGAQTVQTIGYVDALGRARVSIATGDGTSGTEWIRSRFVTFDARGTVARSYDPVFHSSAPTGVTAALATPSSGFIASTFDPFGRPALVIERDGNIIKSIVYHALSRDIWDWHHLQGTDPYHGLHTTERTDGHGRTIDQVLRNKQLGSGTTEFYRLWTAYRADGVVTDVARARTTSAAPVGLTTVMASVLRSFIYDTAGRRIATTDPDTDSRTGGGSWRYLFNRASDLVAVRDPRGCGQDFYFDHASRSLGEKYIGCTEATTKYDAGETIPSGAVLWTETTSSASAHARTIHDTFTGCWNSTPSSLPDYPTTAAGGILGRATCNADRGQRSLFAYDRRGQVIWQARQMFLHSEVGTVAATLSDPLPAIPAKPSYFPAALPVAYDQHVTHVLTRTYDHGGRARQLVLPPSLEYYVTPRRVGRITFGPRGLPTASTIDLVSGATGFTVTDGAISWTGGTVDSRSVVTALVYAADGKVTSATYGDTAGGTRAATVSQIGYDIRRRPTDSWTTRAPTETAIPPNRPLGAVTVPFDQHLTWDAVSNLTSIEDQRLATEWPAGHRPQNIFLEYDALYRVADAEYTYNQDSGPPTSVDSGTDWRVAHDAIRPSDNLRPLTPPMAPTLPSGRVINLQWSYDWLGNMTRWNDDSGSFYERSLTSTTGPPIANGADLTTTQRPSALYLAGNLTGPSGDRGGYVELTYGDSGNVATMTVHAQCVDVAPNTCADPGGTNLTTRLSAVHANCRCSSEQHYQYLWDEVNRLIEARRYDRTGGSGTWNVKLQEHISYDATNQRTVRMHYDRNEAWPNVKWNVEVFPGDFELHDYYTSYFPEGAGYWPNEVFGSESHHLLLGARIVWDASSQLSGLDDGHRITVPLTDLIGTSAAVLDLRTGVLVETSSYYPNGARETFRTDPSNSILPERQGFTGKETDAEIGVTYFGERWLIPHLGRWASPDPIAIHSLGGGEALNSYHYISGNLLQARDPLGLWSGLEEKVATELIKTAIPKLAPLVGGAFSINPYVGVIVLIVTVIAVSAIVTYAMHRRMPRPHPETGTQVSPTTQAQPDGDTQTEPKDREKCRDYENAPIHHIATNKNDKSDVRGGPWTPRFREIFDAAGYDMDDPINKVPVRGHFGPHPEEYHEEIYRRLRSATDPYVPHTDEFREAFENEMTWLGAQVMLPGTPLNSLVTGQKPKTNDCKPPVSDAGD